MMPNTAAASLLGGVALALLTPLPSTEMVASGRNDCALGTCLLAGLTLAEYGLGIDIGLDQLFVRTHESLFGHYPDRPAPQTATTLFLLGASAPAPRYRTSAACAPEVLALLAAAVLVIALLGYLFRIEALYGVPTRLPRTAMAVHTTLVLLVLASGTLVARPDAGLMSIITAEDMGGTAARSLLWSLLVLPPVAVAVVLGARAGLYSSPFAFAFLLFFSLVDGVVVILLTGSRLSRLEGRMLRGSVGSRQSTRA